MRNTLIVEYNKISSVSTTILQQADTSQILSASVLGVFLMKWNIKTAEELRSVDYTEQQNALADALIAKDVSVYSLEGLDGIELVEAGLGVFTDEYVNYDSIKLMITNGVKTVYDRMVASSISYSTEYYFFGCVKVTSEGDYTFVPAPEETFFNGNSESNWVSMMSQ